ncbi:ABC transporter permease subunit [Pseudorhodobacter turbinis]|uniref:ABC transporter permease subunit n=1 Tax=Pseudorhodobacter turbinis TaxID=2500533 RepID=A0A4P8EGP1_9RHOB|nr:ABC transporter permease subunit [Pseudorhodobacter turbinis]QCO55893.1 ABC transporter permease subunit [Pseudorhodobacter turbinis]
MNKEGRSLRGIVAAILLAGFVLPILAGFAQTGRAAFGVLPAIGAVEWSLDPWRALVALPGFGTSLRLSLVTGAGSTVLALMLAAGFCALLHGRMSTAAIGRMLMPLLAAPHAALAIGLAFLLAPSGWIARALSPWLTGWDRPPDLATVNDAWGMALIIGLLIKEVPFLLLVIGSALGQLPVRAQLAAGRALGYGRGMVWVKVIFPQVYPLIRLPIFIVLAFALSVVDMAIILGPSNPPTLAVAITRWFSAPDVALILPASAAALMQVAVVAGAIALWIGAERLARPIGRWWLYRGGRGYATGPGLWAAGVGVFALLALGVLAILALAVWSFAWRWSFPQALPQSWALKAWMTPGAGWGRALQTTLIIGVVTTLASLAMAIAWLEGEDRARRGRAGWAQALIYLPLLLPQIGFLYGLNVLFLYIGISGGMLAVIWAQMLFVFPYVMIALSDPWRALDCQHIRAAAALGASPWRRLVAVKLPMLLRPLMVAGAIGFAVSVAQYLPTLFMGAGRVVTLTTEAVTLASGSDRRIVGVYAVLQAGLPFLAYGAALLVPGLVYRNRRELKGGTA